MDRKRKQYELVADLKQYDETLEALENGIFAVNHLMPDSDFRRRSSSSSSPNVDLLATPSPLPLSASSSTGAVEKEAFLKDLREFFVLVGKHRDAVAADLHKAKSSMLAGGSWKGVPSSIANLLTLTELRKAAWARIYASGLATGDAAISTTRVPSWKQFDTLMIKRHRYIAVDPKDNRTLGWIACSDPHPQISMFYDDDDSIEVAAEDERRSRCAELQVMVAEAERGRGVGMYLVNALLTSLETDRRFSTVQASFFPENVGARKLFIKCGFDSVSTRKNAVKMLDGPSKGSCRDLLTVDIKLTSAAQQSQQEPSSSSTEAPASIDTIDPNAVLKRPRLQ
ncbi:GNAT domain protein [Kalmanozyma brasiliensis GHG001]|uniref:N-acetyltransferase domain-containing protein n=1 Tax=Kalmanozyma brasiliensis (strain GHG001) TaxID=1365824 RepID=V5GFJ5_KALBG|nr:GNAT domain protein [Kalmanozyma brasiliensis GHG001]EST04802.1 GNAT domain protein [Kalmanozyma brasiliensis GHG001]